MAALAMTNSCSSTRRSGPGRAVAGPVVGVDRQRVARSAGQAGERVARLRPARDERAVPVAAVTGHADVVARRGPPQGDAVPSRAARGQAAGNGRRHRVGAADQLEVRGERASAESADRNDREIQGGIRGCLRDHPAPGVAVQRAPAADLDQDDDGRVNAGHLHGLRGGQPSRPHDDAVDRRRGRERSRSAERRRADGAEAPRVTVLGLRAERLAAPDRPKRHPRQHDLSEPEPFDESIEASALLRLEVPVVDQERVHAPPCLTCQPVAQRSEV